jgi:hypothetical protein
MLPACDKSHHHRERALFGHWGDAGNADGAGAQRRGEDQAAKYKYEYVTQLVHRVGKRSKLLYILYFSMTACPVK